MDTVILQEDFTWLTYKRGFFEYKFDGLQRALSHMESMAEESLRRDGEAAKAAPAVASMVSNVLEPVEAVMALETRAKVEEQGRQQYAVGKRKTATRQASKKVDGSTTVLGAKESRDEKRYESLAMQEALNVRLAKALENQEKVVAKEFLSQKRLQERLQKANTEAEVHAIQTSLTASQHRLSLARQKVEQAREDCDLLKAELSVEDGRKNEADREWEERFVEKLRARALTALHAQKGENS